MKHLFLKSITIAFVFFALVFASSCVSVDEPNAPNNTQIINEAAKCDETVTAVVPSRSRAADIENLDRYTATRTDIVGSKYVLVSYHGRNQEQIGMVQLIDPANNEVKGEIIFPDSRVNYCSIRNLGGKMTAYIAVDQVSKKEVKHLCGVVCVKMKDNNFCLGEVKDANGNYKTIGQAELQPYKVDGVSVNCIKFVEQDASSAMIVASGGNSALGDEGLAGFTKFEINNEDPTKLIETGNNWLDANLRGYWVSSLNNANLLPVAYTYRTVEDGDLVWKLAVQNKSMVADFFNPAKPFGTANAEAVVMRKKGVTDDYNRFAVSMFNYKNGRFIVVSTNSKELDESEGEGGGVRVYRYDESLSELTLVDVWNKSCNNTSNMVMIDNEPYLFAACSNGVFKCKIEYTEGEKMPNSNTPQRFVKLTPVEKRVTEVITESGTYASANYVQCNVNMDCVHVAYGYEGYVKLPLSGDCWKPADPRNDVK